MSGSNWKGEPLPALNVPYFEMLEMGGQDEMVDSVVACVEQHLTGQIPRDLPVLSVCAKGDTSEYVRQALERLGYTTAHLQGGMKAWGEYYSTGVVVETPELAIYQCGARRAAASATWWQAMAKGW